jgi:hypothetical protein
MKQGLALKGKFGLARRQLGGFKFANTSPQVLINWLYPGGNTAGTGAGPVALRSSDDSNQGFGGCSERNLTRHGGSGDGSPAAGGEDVKGTASERTPSTFP